MKHTPEQLHDKTNAERDEICALAQGWKIMTTNMNMLRTKHVVSFSGGLGSWAAAAFWRMNHELKPSAVGGNYYER